MVSQKKIDPPWFARYQQDGFDLDLTYVTNRVIATSFPSTGVWSLYRFLYNEQLYMSGLSLSIQMLPLLIGSSNPSFLLRNPIEKVAAFLETKHKDRFGKSLFLLLNQITSILLP